MLENILQQAVLKSEWVAWLVHDSSITASSTREFLNTCFGNISTARHGQILKKLRGDSHQLEATIRELVAHELLWRLGLSPEFEPSVGGLTPDLRFEIEGNQFLGDVYLTHSPSKTLRDFGDGKSESWDTSTLGESRAHKIADELAKKARKYKSTGFPFVAFIFLGDHRGLSTDDVERALFGMTAYEASLEKQFPKSVSPDRVPVGGLFLPNQDNYSEHQNLVAVVSCDWFDTLNRQDPGKRLHCFVLHNWVAQSLPLQRAFTLFPQIIWQCSEPDVWRPEQTISANTVAKFTLDGKFECHEYTPNSAW